MGLLPTDLVVKSMLEAALYDVRKNAWLLDDVFSGLASDPLSSAQYGWKEVARAKDWFLSNNVMVYLPFRIDAPTLPCISIIGPSVSEMQSRANLGDDGQTEDYAPDLATANPQRVYDPFTPAGYDPETGYVTFPQGIMTDTMAPGMFLVSQKSGKAYVIQQIVSSQVFGIKSGTNDDFTAAWVAPVSALWNLQREIIITDQSFTIGCHTQGDPVTITWLRDLVMYCLGRYREAYLEARGFGLSTISCGPPSVDPDFDMERCYKVDINLMGQVQGDWIKYIAPKLQVVRSGILIADGPKTPAQYLQYAEAQGWKMAADAATPPPVNQGNIPDNGEGATKDVQPDKINDNSDEQ